MSHLYKYPWYLCNPGSYKALKKESYGFRYVVDTIIYTQQITSILSINLLKIALYSHFSSKPYLPYIAIATAPAAGSPAATYGDKRSCKPNMPCLSEAWVTRLLVLSVYADAKDEMK